MAVFYLCRPRRTTINYYYIKFRSPTQGREGWSSQLIAICIIPALPKTVDSHNVMALIIIILIQLPMKFTLHSALGCCLPLSIRMSPLTLPGRQQQLNLMPEKLFPLLGSSEANCVNPLAAAFESSPLTEIVLLLLLNCCTRNPQALLPEWPGCMQRARRRRRRRVGRGQRTDRRPTDR